MGASFRVKKRSIKFLCQNPHLSCAWGGGGKGNRAWHKAIDWLMFNVQNLEVMLIGQETKEPITWVTPESGNLDTIWIFSLWNLWKPRSLLHIALESSSLQGFYTFKMYERWLYSRCYSLFVAGKKRLGTVCIQRRKNMCKFSTFTGNMRQTILFQRVLQNFSSVL